MDPRDAQDPDPELGQVVNDEIDDQSVAALKILTSPGSEVFGSDPVVARSWVRFLALRCQALDWYYCLACIAKKKNYRAKKSFPDLIFHQILIKLYFCWHLSSVTIRLKSLREIPILP